MKQKIKLLAGAVLFSTMGIQAQNSSLGLKGDSLSLSEILNEVINNYPAIKKTSNELNAANTKIDLAKTAYLPDISVISSYALIGPTASITIPNMGTFSLYPANNLSAMVNISQSIYDFGRTADNIKLEQQNKEMIGFSTELLKQKLSGLMIGNYYGIVYLQEALKLKDVQIATLLEHLKFVEKKAATGSATQYELLSTKVRISGLETQRNSIEAALQIQVGQLCSFLGKPQTTTLKTKNKLLPVQLFASDDSLLNQAFAKRSEMKIARQKDNLYKTRLKLVGRQNNPTINLSAAGGLKNGYVPDLNKLTPNFSIGLGIRIPIYDANRTKYNQRLVSTEIDNNNLDTELTRRTITNEVVECKANALTAIKNVKQSELQVHQAQEAYALAQTSFKAGSITNLDLLDSYTALTDSEFGLLKSKIDYTISVLKMKIALGDIIY